VAVSSVLSFRVPEIWEADSYAFGPEIELWHELHRNDWRPAKPKLSKWLSALQSRKFMWDVYERGWNRSRQNLSASEIKTEPKRIDAYRAADEISLDQSQLPSEDELINSLVKLIKDYAKIVDSLAS
jgi:hypothetical protein